MISKSIKRSTRSTFALILGFFLVIPTIVNASQKEVWMCSATEAVEMGVLGKRVFAEKNSIDLNAQLEVLATGDVYFNNRFVELEFKIKGLDRTKGFNHFIANLVSSKSKKNDTVFDGEYRGFVTLLAFDAKGEEGVLILSQTMVTSRTVSTSFYFCDKF